MPFVVNAHVNRFECVGTVLHIETDGVDDGPASVQCRCNRRHVCNVGLQRRQALGVLERVQALGSACGNADAGSLLQQRSYDRRAEKPGATENRNHCFRHIDLVG